MREFYEFNRKPSMVAVSCCFLGINMVSNINQNMEIHCSDYKRKTTR